MDEAPIRAHQQTRRNVKRVPVLIGADRLVRAGQKLTDLLLTLRDLVRAQRCSRRTVRLTKYWSIHGVLLRNSGSYSRVAR
jgi:hypothetical protein